MWRISTLSIFFAFTLYLSTAFFPPKQYPFYMFVCMCSTLLTSWLYIFLTGIATFTLSQLYAQAQPQWIPAWLLTDLSNYGLTIWQSLCHI